MTAVMFEVLRTIAARPWAVRDELTDRQGNGNRIPESRIETDEGPAAVGVRFTGTPPVVLLTGRVK